MHLGNHKFCNTLGNCTPSEFVKHGSKLHSPFIHIYRELLFSVYLQSLEQILVLVKVRHESGKFYVHITCSNYILGNADVQYRGYECNVPALQKHGKWHSFTATAYTRSLWNVEGSI